MTESDGGRGQLQGLDRALCILEMLGEHPEGMTISRLAAGVGVDRASVYRVVATLERHRLLQRTDDGLVRLWVGLVELARRAAPAWWSIGEPELASLARDLHATAILTVAAGETAIALLVAEPPDEPMHVTVRPGTRHPLDEGVGGRAILAGRPAQPGERPDVTRARQRGWIAAAPRGSPRAIGVAAPIAAHGWANASVGVATLGEMTRGGVDRVLAAAAAIAAALPAAPSAARPDDPNPHGLAETS